MRNFTANEAVKASHTPGSFSSKPGMVSLSTAMPDRTGSVCPGALHLLK